MRFSTIFVSAALTLAALSSSIIQATPVPVREPGAVIHEAIAADPHSAALVKRASAGFNNWSCKPSALHPRPLVLVHGLSANAIDNWFYMAPRFVAKGYCVFALSYGQLHGIPIVYGLDKMENSAQQLSDYVDRVLKATNTTQVDILGHSQGSIMPRYYLRFLGGAPKVYKFAAIGSIQYGTNILGLVNLLTPLGLYDPIKAVFDTVCLSCFQFLENSEFIKNLNAGGDTVPDVKYLMITSKLEETVTPYTNGFLRDKSPNVKNVVLQNDYCSLDVSEHALQAVDPIVFNAVHAFLTPSVDQTINCLDALN
ncbi:putative secreted lipase [Linnemannia elongata]|nr:putative secreted lipase [Linnemannia elongata]